MFCYTSWSLSFARLYCSYRGLLLVIPPPPPPAPSIHHLFILYSSSIASSIASSMHPQSIYLSTIHPLFILFPQFIYNSSSIFRPPSIHPVFFSTGNECSPIKQRHGRASINSSSTHPLFILIHPSSIHHVCILYSSSIHSPYLDLVHRGDCSPAKQRHGQASINSYSTHPLFILYSSAIHPRNVNVHVPISIRWASLASDVQSDVTEFLATRQDLYSTEGGTRDATAQFGLSVYDLRWVAQHLQVDSHLRSPCNCSGGFKVMGHGRWWT
jgi:hypothetical protein